MFEDEVKKRAQKAHEVVEKYNLVFVSLQNKFDEAVEMCTSEYWLIDGVHPSVFGHNIIKVEWINAIEKLIKKY